MPKRAIKLLPALFVALSLHAQGAGSKGQQVSRAMRLTLPVLQRGLSIDSRNFQPLCVFGGHRDGVGQPLREGALWGRQDHQPGRFYARLGQVRENLHGQDGSALIATHIEVADSLPGGLYGSHGVTES